MIIIHTRIEYVKYLTELQKMTERPATIDWKKLHNISVALEAYETKHMGRPRRTPKTPKKGSK